MPPRDPQHFELTTTIGRLKDIDCEQLEPYGGVYIGDPYCALGVDNLLENHDDLIIAIQKLKSVRKNVYLSTYVEPWTDKVYETCKTIEIALANGINAIEVSDFGILRILLTSFSKAPVYLSRFVTLFNPSTAIFLEKFNVRKIIPYPELSMQEIDIIKKSFSGEIELPIHGKIPLGYTELCTINPEISQRKQKCSGSCYKRYMLQSAHAQMKAGGRVVLSDKDLCLFHHLEILLQKGYRNFRIEAQFEGGHYRHAIGKFYKNHIESSLKKLGELSELSPDGICNGFYFEKPGHEYYVA